MMKIQRRFPIREYQELAVFLQGEFSNIFTEIEHWCTQAIRNTNWPVQNILGKNKRTLSPSDFGFHNALIRPDNRVLFIDFEFFGWDDPAKMISDFLLHPGMYLSFNMKRFFFENMVTKLRSNEHLVERIEIVYPLFGLKWCLILLNEFIPENLQRRHFASVAKINDSEILRQQLTKSRQMLERITDEYKVFPYRR